LFISALIVPPYSTFSPKRCTFLHHSKNTDGIYSNGTTVHFEKVIDAKLMTWDLHPAKYAMDSVKSENIENVECEKNECNYKITELPLLKQPTVNVISSDEPDGAIKFAVDIQFEGSDFSGLNITGDYRNLDQNLPAYQLGTFSNTWKVTFIVPKDGVASLDFSSSYLDLKFTPYLQELFSSNQQLTMMVGGVSTSLQGYVKGLRSQFLVTSSKFIFFGKN
jgi:hypothetical protein